MKKLFLSLSMTGILFTIPLALAQTGGQSMPAESERQQLKNMFSKADVVADGSLDQGEFDMYHMTVFSAIDLDKNDMLKKEECTTECFSTDLSAETYRKNEFSTTPYLFDAIDGDGNNLITQQEYITFSRERFQYFDQNNNGRLSSAEFCSGHMASSPCDFRDSLSITDTH